MNAELLMLGLISAPVVQALAAVALARAPAARDGAYILGALVAATCAVLLIGAARAGTPVRVSLAQPLPDVDLAFALEPFGALMAVVISGLGLLHAVQTTGLLRATDDAAPGRLLACMALAQAGALSIALSANLFTLFVAYQGLALAAFPLVAHGGGVEARQAARAFLATLLGAAIALFLPAMIWTYAVAGALDFRAGGILAGHVDVFGANVLLTLFAFGSAMTALPPLHRWLPASSHAPYPALASIQSVAVLPAGCIGFVKIAAFVFGPVLIDAGFAARALIALAGAGMCLAALIALSRQDIRERLAYSCMAQSLAVVMGALLALPVGLFAAALQVVALSCAATTLILAAGTVSVVAARQDVRDYAGLGRAMPWTFASFAIASASMIGMPPFAGAWAKLWLITAAAAPSPYGGGGLIWAAVLASLAAVLTFAHLAPLAANALAAQAPTDPFKRPDGASIALVAPVVLSAAATLGLLVLADPLVAFLSPMWTPP